MHSLLALALTMDMIIRHQNIKRKSTMQLCFDQPYASIGWNEDLKIVDLTWKGFVSSPEYRQAQEQALVIIKEKKSTRMLMDARGIKVIMPEDQAWALEVWGAKFAQTGAKKLAVVNPENAVALMNARSIERAAAPTQPTAPFEFQSFATLAEAEDWLKS
jgi:hypothetical protein